jgi:ZIP family zinc transporter
MLSAAAGLCTGIGGVFTLAFGRRSSRMLGALLGFSAGIMLTISLADLLPHAAETLVRLGGRTAGSALAALALGLGIALAALLNRALPRENGLAAAAKGKDKSKRLMRLGLFSALAVLVHNLPEGIATFMSAYTDLSRGIPIAVAIALHNIPEGMAVATPIYHATKSRRKAVLASFASGLSEPAGALLAYTALRPLLSEAFLALVFAVIAGLMVYIVFEGLLPSAWEHGRDGAALWGVLAGIALISFGFYLM